MSPCCLGHKIPKIFYHLLKISFQITFLIKKLLIPLRMCCSTIVFPKTVHNVVNCITDITCNVITKLIQNYNAFVIWFLVCRGKFNAISYKTLPLVYFQGFEKIMKKITIFFWKRKMKLWNWCSCWLFKFITLFVMLLPNSLFVSGQTFLLSLLYWL